MTTEATPLSSSETTEHPQFVVFELPTVFNPLTIPKTSKIPIEWTKRGGTTTTTTPFSPFNNKNSLVPFLPMGGHKRLLGQQINEGNSFEEATESKLSFTLVQLKNCNKNIPFIVKKNEEEENEEEDEEGKEEKLIFDTTKKTTQSNNDRCHRRLLFDNPLFRKLPNWHFFGDDRRLTPIPLTIPLLPIPVERTLLSVAPSVSWTRQIILLGLLDIKGIIEAERAAFLPLEEEYEEEKNDNNDINCLPSLVSSTKTTKTIYSSSESETEEPLPPDSVCCCPSSSSGVESMYSGETETGTSTPPTRTRSSGTNTPTTQEPTKLENDCFEEEENSEEIVDDDQAGSSSAANSATSSTPNSPLTFDRRIVRMSRATRNAVLRLSISRRFCEEEEKDEEDDEGKYEEENSALTDEQMALRIRHSSSGSTRNTEKSNNMLQQQFQHYSSKVPISPSGISRMDVLSERIYDFHQNTEQNQMQLNRKLLLRDQLYYAISPIFPLCGLYIVGSSLNGFGTLRSDLDLCLMITNRDIDQKSDAVVVLSSVMRTLKTTMLVVDQQLIPAKVPILRIKCGGAFSDIIVDLNVNNSVAIRNTHLLCYYSAFDWRVRLIVMVVKEWAKRRNINNASQSSFTSYSLV
uniref:Poly(A) RNA polymerase mitochondrial-like central palm domain-containing protein n=1 Tax=Meloidogyne enterolobii TaxID=390850 RepID=A0A6V7U3A8_MELEN|nr:unnamed protein product [Meloidogyne enterolobii]